MQSFNELINEMDNARENLVKSVNNLFKGEVTRNKKDEVLRASSKLTLAVDAVELKVIHLPANIQLKDEMFTRKSG